MRNIFSVPWLTPVLSIVVVIILVFSSFTLLKISNSNKQEPQELLTGSIQKSLALRKQPLDEPTASLVAPSSFRSTLRLVQRAVVVQPPVPLPRPRPKGIQATKGI
jgi:hypothetical protein